MCKIVLGFVVKNDCEMQDNSLKDKKEIIQKISVSAEKAQELYMLCDLVRINGVGAAAAKSFLDAGYKSVSDVANTTAEEISPERNS